MQSNGTILDLMPVGRVLLITGGLLVVLFTLVKPEASNGLGPAARFLFWTLHVSLGLFAIWIASRWLANRGRLPGNILASVLLTACAGLVVAVAGYMLLDVIYANYIIDLDPDPPAGSLLSQLTTEVLELGPWFMATWVLINLPVLLPVTPSLVVNDEVTHFAKTEVTTEPVVQTGQTIVESESLKEPGHTKETPVSTNTPANTQSDSAQQTDSAQQKFLLNLPGIMGTDIVAVSSDLHYLNVWTVAGRTTVLGNLRDVIADLGELGMQVHRSHWVAHTHVRRIVGNAGNAACILSNELRIPVSRRKWKIVREQYGRGVVNRGS